MNAGSDLLAKEGYTRMEDVKYFRNRTEIGQRLNCMVFVGNDDARGSAEKATTCRLLKKGRYTAQTTKGTMQWTLLTVWNKDKLRKYREQDRATARSGRKKDADSLYLLTVQGKQ